MSESNRFFLWIFRIAGTLVLGLLLLLLFFMAWGWWESRQRGQRDIDEMVTVEEKTADGRVRQVSLQFGDVRELSGTGRHVLAVEAKDNDGDDRIGLSSGSSYTPNETRNLVFLDGDYANARWLFPDNDALIVEQDWLVQCPDAGAAEPTHAGAAYTSSDRPCADKAKGLVRAIFLSVRRKDNNGNGRIDERDAQILALVRPDGTGYVELAGTPTQRVLEHELRGESIGLLVQSGSRLAYRRYAIGDFKLASETPVADLSR